MKTYRNIVERLAAGKQLEKEIICQPHLNRNKDMDTISGKITVSGRELIPGKKYKVILLPVN